MSKEQLAYQGLGMLIAIILFAWVRIIVIGGTKK